LPSCQDGVQPVHFDEEHEAHAWFEAEYHVFLALIRAASKAQMDQHIGPLSAVLANYLGLRDNWTELATTQTAALAATRRRSDRHGQAHAHRGLALASARLQDFDAAREQLDSLGYASHKLGDNVRAIEYCRCAADLHRATGSTYSEAEVLQHVGDAYRPHGYHGAARRAWRRATELLDELGITTSTSSGQTPTWPDKPGTPPRQRAWGPARTVPDPAIRIRSQPPTTRT
jgi:hypothetical protein